MTTASLGNQEAKLAKATFASWKLSMIDAMLVDERLLPSDYKVGVALLQFMNSETGSIFPSIETVARMTNLSPRTVRYCLDNLKAAGWVNWRRGNRQDSNRYEFELGNLKPMQARRKALEVTRRERKKPSLRPGSERQPTAARDILTGNPLPVPSGNPLPPNIYMEHLSKRAAK